MSKPSPAPTSLTELKAETLPESLKSIIEGLNITSADLGGVVSLLKSGIDREQLLDHILERYLNLKGTNEKYLDVKQAFVRIAAAVADPERGEQLLSELSSQPSPALESSASKVKSPTLEYPPQLKDFYSIARGIISQARERMREETIGTFDLSQYLAELQQLVSDGADWRVLEAKLIKTNGEIRRMQQQLESLHRDLDDEQWREVLLGDQFESLIESDASSLLTGALEDPHAWFRAYALCLSDWQLEKCKRIASLKFQATSEENSVKELLAAAADHLIQKKYSTDEVDEALQHVLNKRWGDGQADKPYRANLLVLRGRIQLYHRDQPDAARYSFGEAIAVNPDYELPRVGLCEYYIHQTDFDKAKQQLEDAIRLPPELVDGYLGVGKLYEAQKVWKDANEWYDRAADVALKDRKPVLALSKLLAPATGSAYLRLAFKLNSAQPEPARLDSALDAVEHALELGVSGKGDYPQAEALRLKADILQKRELTEEAIEAYSEAGKYFGWSNTPHDVEQASKCFESAIHLGSKKAGDFWHLADVYVRLSQGAADDGAKRNHIERGLTLWNTAAQLPDESSYWAYAVRTELASQRAALLRGESWGKRIDLWWEAVVMLERLLLIMDNRPVDWSLLGRSFDRLYLYENALKRTEKAFELDSNDLFVAEWRTFVLANAGHFEEALKTIEHRLTLNDDRWVYSIRAWVYLHQGQYEEAKKDIEHAYASIEPEKLATWDLYLCATIYERAKDLDRARQDYEIIYARERNRRQEKDIDNLSNYANAAFNLGKSEEAIELLQTPILLRDPLERDSTLRDLGLFKLHSDQDEEGWKHIEDGIALCNAARSLQEYLEACEARLSQPDVDRVASLVQAKVKVLEQPKTLEQELVEAYNTFGTSARDMSWSRVGIQASLARVYREESRWREAAELYQQLLVLGPLPDDDKPPFPEAQRGLEYCVHQIEQLGDEAVKARQSEAAIQHYTQALQLGEGGLGDVTEKECAKRAARLNAKLALAGLDTQGVRTAGDRLATALQLYRRINQPDPANTIAEVLRPILRNNAHYWQVFDALSELTANPGALEAFRQDLATLRALMPGSSNLRPSCVATWLISWVSRKLRTCLRSGRSSQMP
jgi:tetratricopeptide (TPR) repeat protein